MSDFAWSRSGVACILCLLPAAARAQQDTALVPLPAITVDVLRAGLPLRELPLSLTILDWRRTLDAGAGASLEESLRGLPGVQLDNRHNQALGERLSIRGFGARASFGIRGVRVLVDGIPATMADGQTTLNHVDPAQLAGAEVVRGAGAAFLGNAAGGALLLRTGAVAGLRGEYSAGAHGSQRLSVSGSSSGWTGSASWQRQDGYRAHNESQRLLIGATGAQQVGAARLEAAVHAVRYDADNPGSLTLEQLQESRTQANPNNVRQQTGERGTHVQLGGGWLQPVGSARLELRAHAGLRTLDNPIPPRIIELARQFGGVRAQLSGGRGAWRHAAGAEADVLRDDRRNFVNEQGAPGARVLDQDESVRGLAVFAQTQWHPTGSLRLLGALRHDTYRFTVTDALLENGDDSGARSLAATTMTIGAGVTLVPGVLLFANAGTAFETPTTTELANRPDGSGGFNPELDPERTRSYEVGLRAARSRATAELSAFRADVRDKLIGFEVADVPGRQFYRNAGKARHQGVELAATVRPLARLDVHAAWTRLDARFRDYAVAGAQLAGHRIPGVAAHQLEAGVRATPSEATTFTAYVRRSGRVAADDGNSAFAAAYTVAGARAAWQWERGRGLSAGVYVGVDNVFDTDYTAAVSVNAFGGRYYEPGPGRSLYAGLRVRLP